MLAGGAADPQLRALGRAAQVTGIPLRTALSTIDGHPLLRFDPVDARLHLDGRDCDDLRAVFLRPDVFPPPGAGPRWRAEAAAALAVVRGWAAAAKVRRFNADPFGRSRSVSKPAALAAAARLGLAVPRTSVGNDAAALAAWASSPGAALVQKPVGGGDLCRPLSAVTLARLGSRRPAAVIAQERIGGPDLRLFRVGRQWLAFEVRSAALDYRDDPRPALQAVTPPPELLAPLTRLTDAMGLDWAASDFKLCPERGPIYLETNANPMFAAFDRASDGALCRAMLAALGLTTP